MLRTTTISAFASVFAEHTNARDGRVHGAWRRELFSLEVAEHSSAVLGPAQVRVTVRDVAYDLVAMHDQWFLATGMTANEFSAQYGTENDGRGRYLDKVIRSPFFEEERGKLYLQARIKNEVAAAVDPRCVARAHARLQDIAARRFMMLDGQVHICDGRYGWHVGAAAEGYGVRFGRWMPGRPDLRLRHHSDGRLAAVEGMTSTSGHVGTYFDLSRLTEAHAFAAALNGERRLPHYVNPFPIEITAHGPIPETIDEAAACSSDLLTEITLLLASIDLCKLDAASIDAWIAVRESQEQRPQSALDQIDLVRQFSEHLTKSAQRIPGLSEVAERVRKRVRIVADRLQFDPHLAPQEGLRP
ncbi:hypothetical protein [Bosea sp. RAC05]|uniref:hypothetical protein n=1 Tax=Bosea sp. RAC05 TaxID=1842539 RepID=UPI00083DEC55|nr:hypothetical protein [Bosea sp. RAC05]